MATIIIILFILGGFHLIIESIIVPVFRLRIRYKLFKLRDELRELMSENKVSKNDEIYTLLETSVSSTINRIHLYNFSNFWKTKEYFNKNEKQKTKIEKRKKLIDSCEIEEVRKIDSRLNSLVLEALAVNSLGWFYIFFPIHLLIITLSAFFKSFKTIRMYFKQLSHDVSYTNEREFTQISSPA